MTLRVHIVGRGEAVVGPCATSAAAPGADGIEGEALIDLADDHPGLFPWLACRGARCGLCRVTLAGDVHAVAAVRAEECEALAFFSAGASERLGCQIRFIPGATGELWVTSCAPGPVRRGADRS